MRCIFSIILLLGSVVFSALAESQTEQIYDDYSVFDNSTTRILLNKTDDALLHDIVENGGSEEKLLELIKQGADINLPDKLGWTPLHLASYNGRQKMVELLIDNGANINFSNYSGYTALHWAAYQGHDRIVELLIKNGANVDSTNSNGWTPLHEAVQWGKDKAVIALLRNNASRHIKDNDGKYPIDLISPWKDKIMDLLLTRTAKNACNLYLDLLEEFIEEHGHSLTNRVIGGKLAEPGEYQWMVSLGYGNSTVGYTYYCGGVIISENFILTAAHCVVPTYKNNEIVRPSPTFDTENRRDDDSTKTLTREIELIFSHPDYSIAQNWKNDIALILVKKSILFTEDVRPACLQTDIRDENPDIKLLVAGWGSISSKEFVRSNDLRKTQVITMPLSQCKMVMKQYGIDDRQYCAYDPNRRNDSCHGDSGGPLQIPAHDTVEATVVGIVKFGIGCASGFPGIYSRVAFYLDWIESLVWPKGVITVNKFGWEPNKPQSNVTLELRNPYR